MSVYFITLFSLLVLCFLVRYFDYKTLTLANNGTVKHTSTAKFFYILVFAVLVFVAGFRYYVGTDFGNYYLFYERYADEFFEHLKTLNEPGFRFICWIIVLFGGNGSTFIFVASFITIGLFLITIYKNTDMLIPATLLYVFLGCWHGCFNGVRQYLAAAIVFAGLKFIKERKFLKYALVIFIAFLFHSSALMMIFPYFMAYNKISFRNIVLLIAGSLVILFSFTEVLQFAGFLLQEEFAEGDEYITNSVNIFRILVAIAPAIFFLFVYQKRPINKEQQFWFNMLIINGVMMFATSNSTYLARMGIYTAPFSAIGIPELIKGISEKDKKLVTTLILLAFAAFWWYEISNSSSLNNFKWMFNR